MTTQNKNVPVLRFSEFNEDWTEKRLGEVTTKVGSGSTPTGGTKVYQNSGIIFIRSQNVIDNQLNLNDVTFISDEINSKMEGSIVKASDILLNITGGSIGRSCVVPSSFKMGNVNQHVCIIRLNNKNIPIFVQQFISSEKGQKLIFEGQTGSGREGLNFQSIRAFKVKLPTLPEQKKIAAFLTAADEKIQQLTKKKHLLKQYKKSVMQKIFNQEIRFKDDNGNNFADWGKLELGSFLIPTLREVNKPNEKYLAIGIRSHCKGTFQKPNSEPEKIAMDKLYVVRENDLIVNITFAWEGAIAIVKTEDDGGLVSHRFPTYTFNRKISSHHFFQYVLTLKKFRLTLDLISPGGAGRNRVLSKKDFLKIKVELPSVPEQRKITNFLSAIDDKINSVNQQLEKTQKFKKGLLQQMFV